MHTFRARICAYLPPHEGGPCIFSVPEVGCACVALSPALGQPSAGAAKIEGQLQLAAPLQPAAAAAAAAAVPPEAEVRRAWVQVGRGPCSLRLQADGSVPAGPSGSAEPARGGEPGVVCGEWLVVCAGAASRMQQMGSMPVLLLEAHWLGLHPENNAHAWGQHRRNAVQRNAIQPRREAGRCGG